jgi:hypothetical protein
MIKPPYFEVAGCEYDINFAKIDDPIVLFDNEVELSVKNEGFYGK